MLVAATSQQHKHVHGRHIRQAGHAVSLVRLGTVTLTDWTRAGQHRNDSQPKAWNDKGQASSVFGQSATCQARSEHILARPLNSDLNESLPSDNGISTMKVALLIGNAESSCRLVSIAEVIIGRGRPCFRLCSRDAVATALRRWDCILACRM